MVHIRYLAIILILFATCAYSADFTPSEGMCTPGIEGSAECPNAGPNSLDLSTPHPEGRANSTTEYSTEEVPVTKSLSDSRPRTERSFQAPGEADRAPKDPSGSPDYEFVVHFFWGSGCPHCKEEKDFLSKMKLLYPNMKVVDYEVWYDEENASLLSKLAKAYNIKVAGIPVTFIGGHSIIGFSEHSKRELAALIEECAARPCADPADILSEKASSSLTPLPPSGESEQSGLECTEKSKTVFIPWIGNLDYSQMSLPVITVVIAGLDSFNPCAFFVLFSLLGLLIHAKSRKKMFLIGSVFVFFSAFIYFLFMAAWLNLFLFMGQVDVITKIAGAIAVAIAVINIKEFFLFKTGISLTIPDSAKPKLFDRMRKLLRSTSLASIIIGTAVLAIAANAYELLCTAGFPMVFTRILTLNSLTTTWYYLYLVLYNAVYVIPLSIIVILFTVTLGRKHLTERQGRLLKLVSGTMMLALGCVLIIQPTLLSNAFISILLLTGALIVSFAVALVKERGKWSWRH